MYMWKGLFLVSLSSACLGRTMPDSSARQAAAHTQIIVVPGWFVLRKHSSDVVRGNQCTQESW